MFQSSSIYQTGAANHSAKSTGATVNPYPKQDLELAPTPQGGTPLVLPYFPKPSNQIEGSDAEAQSLESEKNKPSIAVASPSAPQIQAKVTALPTPTNQDTWSEPAIIASLRDLQPTAISASNFNPGVRSNSGRSSANIIPTASPTPDDQLPWVTGQSTGFASLAFMHPKARAMAEKQIDTLLKSRIRNIFLAVLADGTFEYDGDFLLAAAQRLSVEGRNLSLLLYLSSGPTMRRWDITPISAAFAQIDPEYFRIAIRFDPAIRDRFVRIAKRLTGVVTGTLQNHPENTVMIVPSLEDNLDRESYRAIRELTRGVFGNEVRIVRNICPGCFPGNDTDSLTDPIEGHTEALLERLGTGDGFTLDGLGYRYDDEALNAQSSDGQLSEQKVKQLKELAIQRGLGYFGLWRKQRQGLGDQLIHPDERSYEIPSDSQMQADMQLLRYGLELE